MLQEEKRQSRQERAFAGECMFSLKKQLIILLVGLALYIAVAARDILFLRSLTIAVIFAVLTESSMLYFKNGAQLGLKPEVPFTGAQSRPAFIRGLKAAVLWRRDKKISFSESSVISGLIIGFVLAGDCAWWVLALASLFAISSKYLIRVDKRHLFNPAGLGIFLAMLSLGANSEWLGTYLWYILIPAGLYLAYKIRKLSLVTGYALATFILFGAQALAQGSSLFNILGTLSYFFIFIMLIEPKTTPFKTKGQIVFGAAVAALIFILSNAGVRFDIELGSLLLLNILVPFINKLPELRLRKI